MAQPAIDIRVELPGMFVLRQRRLERLEATEARRGFRPWWSNDRFEERFRGSRPDLLERYRDLAARLSDGRLNENALAELADDDFIAALTAIPGIGPWTAQGVLLVALRREDVVLPGDLALRKAIRNAYELDRLPNEQEVLAIAEKWRPFRSLATSYLFASAFDRDDVEA